MLKKKNKKTYLKDQKRGFEIKKVRRQRLPYLTIAYQTLSTMFLDDIIRASYRRVWLWEILGEKSNRLPFVEDCLQIAVEAKQKELRFGRKKYQHIPGTKKVYTLTLFQEFGATFRAIEE